MGVLRQINIHPVPKIDFDNNLITFTKRNIREIGENRLSRTLSFNKFLF